ncbi:GNAT family N-acetyltransferase [Pseudoalteromonas sp. T1lg23B]|uniref:GNAT family N-acetyltransferase n=1 Tax=Pseudoalteromonas sp. T1lg23B TaxID=2077097 RepID=UPI000CF6F35F|nr:GNAT family N-acetyltransferase [Pseudoalteromonas sp. T1lg23B]
MQIDTERLIIKSARTEFAPAITKFYLSNKAFFADSQPLRDAHFFTVEHWVQNLKHLAASFEDDSIYQFYLFEKSNEEHVIGQVGLSGIQRAAFQACFLGYQLDQQKNGCGLMHEALTAIIHWAFAHQNFHRIMANYVPCNTKSASVLNKLGFTIEGVAKDYLFLNGEWQDHVLTSLINDRFKF